MLSRRCIGNKHTPEDKLLKSKLKWLTKEELKSFKEEYKQVINNQLVLRAKKMTRKGSDWHINLNPKKLKEIYEALGEKNE